MKPPGSLRLCVAGGTMSPRSRYLPLTIQGLSHNRSGLDMGVEVPSPTDLFQQVFKCCVCGGTAAARRVGFLRLPFSWRYSISSISFSTFFASGASGCRDEIKLQASNELFAVHPGLVLRHTEIVIRICSSRARTSVCLLKFRNGILEIRLASFALFPARRCTSVS